METVTSLAFDPVCGMWLEPAKVVATYVYLGQTYVFCCAECCELFSRSADACLVLLAHEPGQSIGHLCPRQRLARAGQDGDGEGPS